MSRLRKNELQMIVEQLLQVNEQKNFSLETLSDCQSSAIDLGNYLESAYQEIKEEIEPAVCILEAYCENLFRISEAKDPRQLEDICSMVQVQLLSLIKYIQKDLPADRKEVIFLPYKASMWDSLESVWMAARDDEECDAYVIPIPYFEKNSDGSLGEMHYEGDMYPDYVPITSWQEYDMAARRPDEVYIHNPYDSCNFVTSVHPMFYSANLKKYTDRLVYIPYFVLEEVDPDDQSAVDAMKIYIWVPGVVNADTVIVQSEKMKQVYVKGYLQSATEARLEGKHVDQSYLEQKFLGTGSPKIDRVRRIKKEGLEIPEDWLKILKKPNGSWKKVVFYNTGVTAVLAHGDKWVEKIEDTLNVFRGKQEEVVLLWRPHPLIENTLRSLRKELLQKYLGIKEQYLKECWGIFDDTADLDRAVVLSDAYYGDGSSLVTLFREVGKPVMLQNVDVLNAY